MMTIVTHVHLKEGAGPEWDAAMRTRLSAAKKRPGWVEDNSSDNLISQTGE
jgi:hypothetical protein